MADNTLDKIMDKAGQVADTAVKATTSLVNRGKDKAEELSLQNKLSKLHKQLGSLVYALRKNGEENEPMISWYVSEIDRINARIALLQTPTTPPSDNMHVYGMNEEAEEDAMFRNSSGDEFP